MKKSGTLNSGLSKIIAEMGHTDQLTVCDAGFPVPENVCRIDLAVKENLPRFSDVVEVISTDLCVEKIIFAEEAKDANPKIISSITNLFPDAEIAYLPHAEFKNHSKDSRAVVRTGECSPFANVILVSGVTF